MQSKVTFIGCGNMAQAIILGLIQEGIQTNKLFVYDINQSKLASFCETHKTHPLDDYPEDLTDHDIVVLAVKPHHIKDVALTLRPHIRHTHPLFVSIAAGIRLESLSTWLGEHIPCIRTMPNTPSQLGQGITGLVANSACAPHHKEQASQLMGSVGIVTWLEDEALIEVITALSGCGPAYFYTFIDHMAQVATEMGLPYETANTLAIHTAMGAAKMACAHDAPMASLIAQVCSKGGATEQALITLEQHGLKQCVKKAMLAAKEKSLELSQTTDERRG